MAGPRLALRAFDYASAADCALAAKWANDPEIRHFSRVFRDEADYAKRVTAAEVAGGDPARPSAPGEAPAAEKRTYMLLLDGEAVGDGSVAFDPPHALTKEPRTAWFGITIGEAPARGRGLGAGFFRLLEAEAERLGARQGELGVFEYNLRAIRLYERLGYVHIGEIRDFCWWDGRKWADRRYLKRFV